MRKMYQAGLLALLASSGCADRNVVIQRYRMTDLETGKAYVAEGLDINKTAGGVVFREAGTGNKIDLSNYREEKIDPVVGRIRYNWGDGMWERIDGQ